MLRAFIALATRGGECSASYLSSFISGKMTPSNCSIGGYMSPSMLYDYALLKLNWAVLYITCLNV